MSEIEVDRSAFVAMVTLMSVRGPGDPSPSLIAQTTELIINIALFSPSIFIESIKYT